MTGGEIQHDTPPAAAPLRSIEDELIGLIAANAQRANWFTVAGAALPTAVLATHLAPQWPLLWWLTISLAIGLRTRYVLALDRDPAVSTADKMRRLAVLYTGMACLQSLLLVFYPFVPPETGGMLSMYLVGMCSGMVPSTAGARSLVLPYTLVVMTSIALTWGFTPRADFAPLDRALFFAMSILFARVLIDYARSAYAVFSESYAIRLERVELNEKLQRALDGAEAANRAKTRFLASASHDLRQPIHALSLFSGSLLLRGLDARSRGIAEQIDGTVRVLVSQLDALLDISRLDAGVVDTRVGIVDLGGLLEQLAADFRPQAEHKGLALRLECSASAATVWTDPVLLHRIVGNLLSNAVKYTDAGHIEISAQRLGQAVRLRIRDTGRGIPASEHARVFEEFYQLGNPERDRSKGLGLGLAIVRRLTDLLGVGLHLESGPGHGTAITLDLQPAVARDAVGSSTALVPADNRHLHVLVVDDEEAVRSGMTTLLEELGFSVEAAASTQEAVASAQRKPPNVVLADFRLRGQDSGLIAIGALRRLWPHLPALLVSGDTGPDRLREARAAQIPLLHKPVTPELLKESICQAVLP